MNPVYDLVIIGVIAIMVLLNLYHVRDRSRQMAFFSEMRKKLTGFYSLGPKTPVRHHVST